MGSLILSDARDIRALSDGEILDEIEHIENMNYIDMQRAIYRCEPGHVWFQCNRGPNPILGFFSRRFRLLQLSEAPAPIYAKMDKSY